MMNCEWCAPSNYDIQKIQEERLIDQKYGNEIRQGKLSDILESEKKIIASQRGSENKISLKHKKPIPIYMKNYEVNAVLHRGLSPSINLMKKQNQHHQIYQYPVSYETKSSLRQIQYPINRRNNFWNNNGRPSPLINSFSKHNINQQNLRTTFENNLIQNKNNQIYQNNERQFQKSSLNTQTNNQTTSPSQISIPRQYYLENNTELMNASKPVYLSTIGKPNQEYYSKLSNPISQNIKKQDKTGFKQQAPNFLKLQKKTSKKQHPPYFSSYIQTNQGYQEANSNQSSPQSPRSPHRSKKNKSCMLNDPWSAKQFIKLQTIDCKKTESIAQSQLSDAFSQVILSHKDFISSSRHSDYRQKNKSEDDFECENLITNYRKMNKRQLFSLQSPI